MTKTKIKVLQGAFVLEIGICLEFGAWDLGF
jgi:hypothetical protein